MSDNNSNDNQEQTDHYTDGNKCPIVHCEQTIGDGHWVASGDGYHTYHTDKEGIARLWEHRDRLDVTPTIKPFNHSVETGTDGGQADE